MSFLWRHKFSRTHAVNKPGISHHKVIKRRLTEKEFLISHLNVFVTETDMTEIGFQCLLLEINEK